MFKNVEINTTQFHNLDFSLSYGSNHKHLQHNITCKYLIKNFVNTQSLRTLRKQFHYGKYFG